MIPGDEKLSDCCESELLWMARIQGLPLLRRGLPKEELIAIVVGDIKVEERHLSPTNFTRERLEGYILQNYTRLYGSLPGCNGHCRTFRCSEGKHMGCFVPNEARLV